MPLLRLALALSLLIVPSWSQAPIRLRVDVTDASRRLINVTEIIPAHTGLNTFEYPEWIPGHHMPDGPIDNLAALVFHAGTPDGPVLPWRRDLVDMYAFHVEVPKATAAVAVSFTVLAVPSHLDTTATSHFSSHVGMLEMSNVVLYPAAVPVRQIPIVATIHMPAGWQAATALRVPENDAPALNPSDTTFAAVSVEQLVDSPIVFGQHCRQYPLAPEIKPVHTLDVCADKPEDLDLQPELLAAMNGLVRQTTATFRSHHYDHFDFLIAVSSHLQGDSLEHTQSADYIVEKLDLRGESYRSFLAYVLPHEYVHSWCGKYRRPIGLATPDYHLPMQDDLLWVYEGLTQYYGYIMTARAGFQTPAEVVDAYESEIDRVNLPGRQWRPLQDTADASSILRGGDLAWYNLRLSQDYYSEGNLVWHSADAKIRELTHGARSLDDFASTFLAARPGGGLGDTGPGVLPFTFADVVAGLNAVAPYDWAGFWTTYLAKLNPEPPTAGLDALGYSYRMVDTMSPAQEASFVKSSFSSVGFSLGFIAGKDGTIYDVAAGTPAFLAGLGPGDKLTAVNGTPFTAQLLRKAIHDSVDAPGPILLSAERNGESASYSLPYHGGERYRRLLRNDKPDLLTTLVLHPK